MYPLLFIVWPQGVTPPWDGGLAVILKEDLGFIAHTSHSTQSHKVSTRFGQEMERSGQTS